MILLLVVVKDLYLYLGGMPPIAWLRWVLIIVMVLLGVYLWAVMLFSANAVLAGAPLRFSQSFRHVYLKISSIYSGLFALVLAMCLLFLVGYLLSNALTAILGGAIALRSFLILILIGLPLTFILVLWVFVLPLLVLEPISVVAAFRRSMSLVGYNYWLRGFSVYAAFLVLFFIESPVTGHGQWLAKHYFSFLFDAVILAILLPLLTNYFLLLLNDLRLRK